MNGTVEVNRERQRLRRLRKLAAILSVVTVWMWWRIANGETPWPAFPQFSDEALFWLPGIIIILLLAIVLIGPMLGNSRSPHVIFRAEQLKTSFADVKGLGRVLDEVGHTLRVLLDHETLRNKMGGSPRRGVLFEGPPGTGKTHVAKAMAKEAGVPFLFVSATAFQSMWFGMTARKIRSFFRALRKAARREGGAIGFIEEIDAIGLSRTRGSAMSPGSSKMIDRSVSSDTGGIVNELLIQMQSFDEPTTRMRLTGSVKIILAHRREHFYGYRVLQRPGGMGNVGADAPAVPGGHLNLLAVNGEDHKPGQEQAGLFVVMIVRGNDAAFGQFESGHESFFTVNHGTQFHTVDKLAIGQLAFFLEHIVSYGCSGELNLLYNNFRHRIKIAFQMVP